MKKEDTFGWQLQANVVKFTVTIVVISYFCTVSAAPASYDSLLPKSSEISEYFSDISGCYYNFQRYDEGDRIVTNEPCLNCTCHNRMLMCYLRVCPFTKAIGHDCTVEKKPDQCCPVITCPEVPVKLLTSLTTSSPTSTTVPVKLLTSSTTTSLISTTPTSEFGFHDNYGCTINNSHYDDGAQVMSDPLKPCQLCYCIRNHAVCVTQECTLHVEGCKPVYHESVCCPVKYECGGDGTTTTSVWPTISDTSDAGPSATSQPSEGVRLPSNEAADTGDRFGTTLREGGESVVVTQPNEQQSSSEANRYSFTVRELDQTTTVAGVLADESVTKLAGEMSTHRFYGGQGTDELVAENLNTVSERNTEAAGTEASFSIKAAEQSIAETATPKYSLANPETTTRFEKTTSTVGSEEVGAASTGIPGEGSCLVDGITYPNASRIESSNPCHAKCTCVSSIPTCTLITCDPPPPDPKCMPVQIKPESCCPVYVCNGSERLPPLIIPIHNQIVPDQSESEEVYTTPEVASQHPTTSRSQATHLADENVYGRLPEISSAAPIINSAASVIISDEVHSTDKPILNVPIHAYSTDKPTQDVLVHQTNAPSEAQATEIASTIAPSNEIVDKLSNEPTSSPNNVHPELGIFADYTIDAVIPTVKSQEANYTTATAVSATNIIIEETSKPINEEIVQTTLQPKPESDSKPSVTESSPLSTVPEGYNDTNGILVHEINTENRTTISGGSSTMPLNYVTVSSSPPHYANDENTENESLQTTVRLADVTTTHSPVESNEIPVSLESSSHDMVASTAALPTLSTKIIAEKGNEPQSTERISVTSQNAAGKDEHSEANPTTLASEPYPFHEANYEYVETTTGSSDEAVTEVAAQSTVQYVLRPQAPLREDEKIGTTVSGGNDRPAPSSSAPAAEPTASGGVAAGHTESEVAAISTNVAETYATTELELETRNPLTEKSTNKLAGEDYKPLAPSTGSNEVTPDHWTTGEPGDGASDSSYPGEHPTADLAGEGASESSYTITESSAASPSPIFDAASASTVHEEKINTTTRSSVSTATSEASSAEATTNVSQQEDVASTKLSETNEITSSTGHVNTAQQSYTIFPSPLSTIANSLDLMTDEYFVNTTEKQVRPSGATEAAGGEDYTPILHSTWSYRPIEEETTPASDYHPHPSVFPTVGGDGSAVINGTDNNSAEEYDEDSISLGPGTCRYAGKLYVSAQQIPRDDPCDFCFCFRGDIICLQQSCPPPIHGCRQEPIQGFCCPRYECPVAREIGFNVTTTSTTTTTTTKAPAPSRPPRFPLHSYKGSVRKSGCVINGYFYNVGDNIAIASGPCLECVCGADGRMKCDPKSCSPEPFVRQMTEALHKRRR